MHAIQSMFGNPQFCGKSGKCGTTRQGLLRILPQSAAGFLFGKSVATKMLSDFYLAANLNFSTPSADADADAPPLGEGGNKHSLRSFKF